MTLALFTFALIHLAAVISPGPSFIIVVRTAVAQSRGHGIAVAAGLAISTFFWALGAWFGLAGLFEMAPWLFDALQWGGAAFLVFLAVMLWRHAKDPVPEIIPEAGKASYSGALRLGLLTQFANPKVAVFFGSIFLLVLPADPSSGMLIAVFAIVVANEFGWYALLAIIMAARPARTAYLRTKPWIDRLTGVFLGGLGLKLLSG